MATYITKPVYLFPPLAGGLTATTKIPCAQRSSADAPEDNYFTPEDIRLYFESRGILIIDSVPEYADDNDAALAGVEIGEVYFLSNANSYNLPGGLMKKRTV